MLKRRRTRTGSARRWRGWGDFGGATAATRRAWLRLVVRRAGVVPALTVLAGALAILLRRSPRLGVAIGVTGFLLLAAVPLFLISYSGGV